MGQQIIKQPNGLYAIWSTHVDDFLWYDMTAEEYVKIRADEAAEEARELIRKMEAGECPYHHWMTYAEAIEYRDMLAKARARDNGRDDDE